MARISTCIKNTWLAFATAVLSIFPSQTAAEINFLKARPTSQTYLPENSTKAPENHDLIARFPSRFDNNNSVVLHIGFTWGRGGTLGDLIKTTMSRIEKIERDGQPGLSISDLDMYRGMKFAEYRTRSFHNLFRHDLNGDLLLTHEEYLAGVERLTPDLRIRVEEELSQRGYVPDQIEWYVQRRLGKSRQLWRQNDQNEDGIVTVQEVMRTANRYLIQTEQRANLRYFGRPRQPPRAMDLDRDGTITRSEVEVALTEAFPIADRNGDGRITRDEAMLTWNQ